MKKEIILNNEKIEYSVKKSKRAKRLRIAVYCNANVLVTLPYERTDEDAEKYLKDKSQWVIDKLRNFKSARSIFKIQEKKMSFEENKEKAYKFVQRVIRKFNKIYKFEFKSINIKNHKTKWGSCSKKKNLNFNYRIIFLPKRLAEYIVVHELCHLTDMSHSRKFWILVEKLLPEYRKLMDKLKRTLIIN